MRQLIGVSLLERGPVGDAGDIAFGRGTVAKGADLGDTQHIRHQQIRSGEAVRRQPLPLAENPLDMVEPRSNPAGQPIVLGPGDLEEPPRHRRHFDRVERGDHPFDHLRLVHRIAWHEYLALAREMQKAGAALEHLDLAIAQERHLAEGLACEMIGLAPVERDGLHRINQTGFLARPSEPEIAHEAARAWGEPNQASR